MRFQKTIFYFVFRIFESFSEENLLETSNASSGNMVISIGITHVLNSSSLESIYMPSEMFSRFSTLQSEAVNGTASTFILQLVLPKEIVNSSPLLVNFEIFSFISCPPILTDPELQFILTISIPSVISPPCSAINASNAQKSEEISRDSLTEVEVTSSFSHKPICEHSNPAEVQLP